MTAGTFLIWQVDTVEEVPDMIRRLQADQPYARAIARAGQERMAQMDTDEVAHFCYTMLKGYCEIAIHTASRRGWLMTARTFRIGTPRGSASSRGGIGARGK